MTDEPTDKILKAGERVSFTLVDGETVTETIKTVRRDQATGDVELEFE